jgi:antitoxin component HigA of HigAB toxin-antitoxin module
MKTFKVRFSEQQAAPQPQANQAPPQVMNINNQMEAIKTAADTKISRMQQAVEREKMQTTNKMNVLSKRRDAVMKNMKNLAEEIDIKNRFFIDKVGSIIRYMMEGPSVLISPENKRIVDAIKSDYEVKDIISKIKKQIDTDMPNVQMLEVLKMKIGQKIRQVEMGGI